MSATTSSFFAFSGIGAKQYLVYLLAEFVMVVSPGAAVLFVMNRAFSNGFYASALATLGVLSANVVYFVISALGLSALILAYPLAFKLLQYAGAVYLLYLAYGAWFAKVNALSFSYKDTTSHFRAFFTIFFIQLANPKAMLTFAAIVPPFINPDFPIGPQMTWLAVGSLVPEFIVLLAYGGLAVSVRAYFSDPQKLRLLERLSALMLLAIAVLVFMS